MPLPISFGRFLFIFPTPQAIWSKKPTPWISLVKRLKRLVRTCRPLRDYTEWLFQFGFYVGFLLLFILIVGIYVAYTGLVKRETTKAIRAVLNFVVVFILSASFIAYAPDYIAKINDFSKDVSTASLDIGTKIVLPDTDSQGKDSVDMIRDSLFSVQVKQPWLLLQYGSTDIETLGEDRVEKLLATSPDTNNGEDRENVVIEEIEDHDNTYLTLPKTISRLGTVFLFVFNIGISILFSF